MLDGRVKARVKGILSQTLECQLSADNFGRRIRPWSMSRGRLWMRLPSRLFCCSARDWSSQVRVSLACHWQSTAEARLALPSLDISAEPVPSDRPRCRLSSPETEGTPGCPVGSGRTEPDLRDAPALSTSRAGGGAEPVAPVPWPPAPGPWPRLRAPGYSQFSEVQSAEMATDSGALNL